MESHLQALIDYFAVHPELALGAVFAAALVESLAVVGTLFPGSSIVFAGGMLVGLKALDPWFAAAAAIAGAIVGDGVSYWLGRRYHAQIRLLWPLGNHPALFERGDAYFRSHGGKSVFLGRFLGPLRAIVPIVAGMSAMPAGHFYAMNALSAVAWAAAHLLPGMLFGASLQIAGAVSSRLVMLVALLVLGLWVIVHAIRFAVRLGGPYVGLIQDRIVRNAKQRRGRLARLVLPLVDPARHESLSLLVAATLLIGGAWLLLGVVEGVVTTNTLAQVDRSVYEGLQAIRTGWADDIMVTLSALGSDYVTIAVIAVVALWLVILRRWQALAYWIAAVAFAEVLVVALKLGLDLARPGSRFAQADPYEFPSGHAALALVVYGFLAFLIAHGKPGWQKVAIALPIAGIAMLIALSRLYLGAHGFSDVAASVGLAFAWIGLLCIAYITHARAKPLRALPMLIVVFTTMTFFGAAYAYTHHDRDLARYAKPVTMRTLAFDRWKDGEWRTLPPARSESRGKPEEPFTVQWVATPERIAEVLGAAQWSAPPRWKSSASLLWIVPTTPIGELPVLPKLHQGQPAALTFVRPLDAKNRLVIRLWRVADIDRHSSGSRLPLYSGVVTAEQARTEFGLVATARTTKDETTPLLVVAQAARAEHAREESDKGVPVLLVW